MTCQDVRDHLAAYLDGELDKKKTIALHRHLSACEACVREEIDLRNTKHLLNQHHFAVLPDNFDEQLSQKIRRIESPFLGSRHDVRKIVYTVAATIILMIGLQVLVPYLSQPVQTPIRFKDFPTARAIFRVKRTAAEPSLQDRLRQRFAQTRTEKISGKSRVR